MTKNLTRKVWHMNNLVTVIMPVYNGEKYIQEAIESVLNQTYTNIELIVVDDGSIDKTNQIVKKIRDDRVRIYEQGVNTGKVAAINKGFLESKGEAVLLLAADDVLSPDSIEKRVKCLGKFDVAYCDMWICNQNLDKKKRVYNGNSNVKTFDDCIYYSLLYNFMGGGVNILSRKIADRIFPIPETLKFEDWWITIFSLIYAKNIYYLSEPLVYYRIHGDNDNGNLELNKRDAAIKKDFKRHMAYYEALEDKLETIEIENKEQILQLIEVNKLIKEDIVDGKFLAPNRRFIKIYGLKEYLKLNIVAKEKGYLLRKIARFFNVKGE